MISDILNVPVKVGEGVGLGVPGIVGVGVSIGVGGAFNTPVLSVVQAIKLEKKSMWVYLDLL